MIEINIKSEGEGLAHNITFNKPTKGEAMRAVFQLERMKLELINNFDDDFKVKKPS